jgi:hypothetical protein
MKRTIEFIKTHIRVLSAAAAVALVLVAVFFLEGRNGASDKKSYITDSTVSSEVGETEEPEETTLAEESEEPQNTESGEAATNEPKAPEHTAVVGNNGEQKQNAVQTEQQNHSETTVDEKSIEYSVENGMVLDDETGKDKYLTDPVPEGMPLPEEPENVSVTDEVSECTLSISCATVLNNMDRLKKEKRELIPSDGWIMQPESVTFYEGENVFNVLLRTMKQKKIHMEFVNTPMYNSAYIEGINNLYQFDCGEGSGWMYKVNGWYPNYGCSRYVLKAGDKIEFVYTCDNGRDVGGNILQAD